jgi:flagellar biosynthesis/type III secretory pathway protein FliH
MTIARARIIKNDGTWSPPTEVSYAGRRIPRAVMDAKDEAARIIAGAEAKAREAAEAAAVDARAQETAKMAAGALALKKADEDRAARDVARTIEVATLLAERLVGEALNVQPARIAELAASALEQTRGARKIRIDANPADAETLVAVLGQLGHVAEVSADDSLGRGDLVVHTELGGVDARLRPQLARLAEVLRP